MKMIASKSCEPASVSAVGELMAPGSSRPGSASRLRASAGRVPATSTRNTSASSSSCHATSAIERWSNERRLRGGELLIQPASPQ